MKYVVKLGPEQEKHLLNNYLINSGSIASHCHPNDFIAWVVTSHDLCLWNDWSHNCWLSFFLFVMLMEPEDFRGKGKKWDFKRIRFPHCWYLAVSSWSRWKPRFTVTFVCFKHFICCASFEREFESSGSPWSFKTWFMLNRYDHAKHLVLVLHVIGLKLL